MKVITQTYFKINISDIKAHSYDRSLDSFAI